MSVALIDTYSVDFDVTTETADIEVPYEFLSEWDDQRCSIRVWNADLSSADGEYIVWSNGDAIMSNTGTLSFPLGAGTYILNFQVQSDRFWETSDIPLLSFQQGFTVEAAP